MGQTLIFKAAETGDEPIRIDSDRARLDRLRKRVTAWARAINDLKHKLPGVQLVGVCLTYRPGDEWQPDDVKTFMKRLTDKYAKNLLAYAWVAEMQTRGAVHYHVCLVLMPGTLDETASLPHFDATGDWPHGWTTIQWLQNASGKYLMEYAQKGNQKRGFPPHLRLFACVIRAKDLIEPENLWHFRLSALPGFVARVVLKIATNIAKFVYQMRVVKGRKKRVLVQDGWYWHAVKGCGVWLVGYYRYWEKAIPDYVFLGIDGEKGKAIEKGWNND